MSFLLMRKVEDNDGFFLEIWVKMMTLNDCEENLKIRIEDDLYRK